MLAACTIVSPNYLPFARTLAASWREHHPDAPFFVLLVADLPPAFTLPLPESTPAPFTAVPVSAIGIPNLRVEAMKYDILELNTNVKPAFLQYLFASHPDIDHLLYLDPDIRVFAPLTPVTDLLGAGASAILTPHITAPIGDTKAPSEQDMLYNGTYNLGFIGLRRSPVADAVLVWWNRRCLDLGFSEGRTGLFVDQKWMNLLPGVFPDVAILRDAGCNMAYWNLHERSLIPDSAPSRFQVQNPNSPPVPLRFFHFSGLAPDEPTVISRNTDRFTLPERLDLQPIFSTYLAELRANRNPATDAIPYGFDRLSDNTAITRLARRLFAAHVELFAGQGTHVGPGSHNSPYTSPDPFDIRGPFAAFARRLRLVAGPAAPPKNTWKQFNPQDRRVQAIHRLLRAALRLLGPNRYELLMRYLAFIAVLRHQGAFLQPTAADLDPSPRSGRIR